MTQDCSVCGVEAVATCADCGEGFCWSHGDGIPAGSPGRLHAACATLAASRRANEARELARAVAAAAFETGAELADEVRVVWSVVGDERDDDPRHRFRHLADVVVVTEQRPESSGLGVDADGHFWDLGPPAEAPLVITWTEALRPARWRRRRPASTERRTLAPPHRGLTGDRRRSDDLTASTPGDRELRLLRRLAEGPPDPPG